MTIDLIKELKEKKFVFGSREVIKQLNKGNVETIYLAKDCPFQQDIKKAAENRVKKLDLSSAEIRMICKRPFNISAIAVLKEKVEEAEEKKPKKEKVKVKKEKTKKKEK